MSSLISGKKAQENLALAKENYEKAKKKTQTTLLRWKPDWEGAAKYYRDAVKYYKMSGEGNEAATVQALKESAIAHREIQSWHTAAADLEAAGTITRDALHEPRDASNLFNESAILYRAQGQSHDKAASVLIKAGECLGENDLDIAGGVEYMKQACAIFEEEGRAMFHDATFKKAISFCVNKKKFGSARSLLQKQIVLAQQHLDTFEIDIYKNCLSIIILRFHTEDYEKASEELQKFEEIQKFARSEYCLVANSLISAYEDGDADAFAAACKSNTIKYLATPIAVIARKLKLPEDQIQRQDGKPVKGAASSSSSAPKKSKGKRIELEEEEEEKEIDLR